MSRDLNDPDNDVGRFLSWGGRGGDPPADGKGEGHSGPPRRPTCRERLRRAWWCVRAIWPALLGRRLPKLPR